MTQNECRGLLTQARCHDSKVLIYEQPNPRWQNGVIYQIYPKSFQDSTGNGYGDLAGVTRRLDYLQELGVDAIWLTPVYVSPQVDNGYDVADYCAIDPAYGTMADFEQLVAAAHRRGIRIVMDMVFNHTSTEHPWFKAAQDRHSPYRQFYVWRDGEGIRRRTTGAPNSAATPAVARRQRPVLPAPVRHRAGGSQLGTPAGARRAEESVSVLGG